MMTIPPNSTVDHELQAVLAWACQRGRQLAAAERAVARAETMRNGRLPEPEPEVDRINRGDAEPPSPTEASPTEPSNVIGGGRTRFGQILWLLDNRGPQTVAQLAAALGVPRSVVCGAVSVLSRTNRVERPDPTRVRNSLWRLPEKVMP